MYRFSMTCLGLIALGSTASAEVPRVVTDIPVTQSLVAQVMGNLGTPSVVMGQSGNAHSYQMRPSEARALDQADLVIWIGPEMTPWLARAIDASGKSRPQLVLLHSDGTHTRGFAKGHDDHDDHGHDHDHEDEDGHSHEGTDPHAWLDPTNASAWLGTIAQNLAQADPENAAIYTANAEKARADLASLDAELTAALKPAAGKPFVVYHDAYGYFADHYNLKDAGSIAAGDATTAGAAHLSALRQDLAQDGIVCAFPEAGHDPRTMKQVTEGTSVRLGDALDPEGTAIERGAGLYAELLRSLSGAMTRCLTQN